MDFLSGFAGENVEEAAAKKSNTVGKVVEIAIWIGFCILAFGVTAFECMNMWTVFSQIYAAAVLVIGPINPRNAAIHMVLVIAAAVIALTASAFINPYLITRLAGPYRRQFAQGFAAASILFIATGLFALLFYHGGFKPEQLVGALPGALVVIAGVLQLRNSLQVAKANLHLFKNIEQLSGDQKSVFEAAIHDLKKAQNQNECNILATRCIQLLMVKGASLGLDDFHALTKELVKQKRRQDSEEISAHYVALIEKTLPS